MILASLVLLSSIPLLGIDSSRCSSNFMAQAPTAEKEAAPQNQTEDQQKEATPPEETGCTARKGRALYKELGSAMHTQRPQDELSPSEWVTTILFHRIRVPFTAQEQCNLIRYFTGCDTAVDETWSEIQKVAPPAEDDSSKQVDTQKVSSCRLGNLPKSNFMVKGSSHVDFIALNDNTNTFAAGLNPLFLWRYGERILFETELEISLEGTSADFGVEYTDLNYVMNDFVTIRGGKFLLPLGFWKEKMHPEWINKLPNPPLPYADEDSPVIPPSDLGADFRGAIPIGDFFGAFDVPMVITYDAWVGNGPAEKDDGNIDLTGTNYTDNNNNKAFGGRFSFRPWPYREIGISGMRGQWNNNGHQAIVTSHKKLYYNAAVLELDCHFNDYCRFCGEYLWTTRNAVKSSDLDIKTDQVIVRSFWAQFSSFMNMVDTRYIKNLELIARYGLVDSDIKKDKKRQMSFGLNYYLTSKCIFKFSYDINRGPANPFNSFNMQWAYGY